LLWNFVTPAGAFTQTAVTPTDTAGDYDWVNQGNGLYTIEIPASGGASINNDTEGFGWFSGYATGILPWRGPVIGFRAAGLNDALIESAWSATRGLAGTALPVAAADAAGGLPISDAGGLDMDAILADTNELQADDYPTSIAAIKAETAVINAFWNVFILVAGTIGAVGNDTTHLHMTGLGYGNDELNDYLVVVYDNSEAEYHSAWITDWVLATALATVETLAFTPEDSVDTYWILAIKKHPDITSILDDTDLIDDGTSGLAKIAADVADVLADTNELQTDDYPTSIAAIKAETALIVADTNELQTDDIPGVLSTHDGKLDTVDTVVDGIQTDLSNATDGLGALKALIDTVDGVVDAILLDTGTDGVVLKAAGLNADAVDEILDEVIEGTTTLRQAIRLFLSALASKSSGGGTSTIKFRDVGDSKDRITATVDSDGNRTAMTLDAS